MASIQRTSRRTTIETRWRDASGLFFVFALERSGIMEDNFFKRSAPCACPNPTSKNLRAKNSKPKRVGVARGINSKRSCHRRLSNQCAAERVREFFGATADASDATRMPV